MYKGNQIVLSIILLCIISFSSIALINSNFLPNKTQLDTSYDDDDIPTAGHRLGHWLIKDMIDTTTGNVMITSTDLVLHFGSFEFKITRYYNSLHSEYNRGFGKGWMSNVLMYLEEHDDMVIIYPEDGSQWKFTNTSGSLEPPTGLVKRLEYQTDEFVLSDPDGEHIIFDAQSGLVKSIINPFGVSFNFEYSPTIDTVINTTFDLTISSPISSTSAIIQVTDGKIAMVQELVADNPTGRRIEYTYDSATSLLKKVKKDGIHTSRWLHYAYDQEGYLVRSGKSSQETVGSNSYWTHIVYDADKKARAIYETRSSSYKSKNNPSAATLQILKYPEDDNQLSLINELGQIVNITMKNNLPHEIRIGDSITRYEWELEPIYSVIEMHSGNQDTPMLRSTYYDYAAEHGGITSITYPDGNTTSIIYNWNPTTYSRDIVSIQHRDGARYNFSWLSDHRIEKLILPTGTILNYTWNGIDCIKRPGPAGTEYSYQYDAEHRLEKVSHAGNSLVNYTYNTIGLPERATVGTEDIQYEWDTSATGEHLMEKLELGMLSSITDFSGNTTTFEYDAGSWLKRISRYDTTMTFYRTAKGLIETTDFDTTTNLTEITSNPISNSYDIDRYGLLTNFNETETPDLGITNGVSTACEPLNHIVYYPSPQITSASIDILVENRREHDHIGQFNQGSYEYDSNGRIIKAYDAAGNYESYSYDRLGNLIAKIDRAGNVVQYEYDTMNRLVKKTHELQNGSTVYEQWQYDAMGRIIQHVDSTDKGAKYTYTDLGLIKSVQLVTSTDLIPFEYYNYTDFTLTSLRSVYDIEGVGSGLIMGATSLSLSANTTYNFEHDYQNRKMNITTDMGLSVINHYDLHGRVVNQTLTDGRHVIDMKLIDYTDGKGYGIQISRQDGTIRKLAKNRFGKPVEYTVSYQGEILKHLQWEYDQKNHLITLYDSTGVGIRTETDSLGRIKKKSYVFTNGSILPLYTYNYDKFGNLVQVNTSDLAYMYHYDTNQRLQSVFLHDHKIEDQATPTTLEPIELWNCTRDALGRIISEYGDDMKVTYTYHGLTNNYQTKSINDHTHEFTYDEVGRLISIRNPDGTSQSYTYNSIGLISEINSSLGYNYRNFTYLKDKDTGFTNITIGYSDGTTTRIDTNWNTVIRTSEKGSYITNYHLNNHTVTILRPDKTSITYQYDPLDRLTSIQRRNATTDLVSTIVYQFNTQGLLYKDNQSGYYLVRDYDPMGNLIKVENHGYDGNQPPVTIEEYTWDYRYGKWKVSSNTNANGIKTQFTWSKLGTELIIAGNDDTQATISYDPWGKITKIIDTTGNITTYQYNAYTQLTSIEVNGNEHTKYRWDHDTLINMTSPTVNGWINFHYNAERKITSIDYPDGTEVVYTYDAFGRLSSEIMPNKTTTFSYDGLDDDCNGMIDESLASINSYNSSNDLIAKIEYSYDIVGRLTSKKTSYFFTEQPILSNISWKYDCLDRLVYSNASDQLISYEGATTQIKQIQSALLNITYLRDVYGRTQSFIRELNDTYIDQTNLTWSSFHVTDMQVYNQTAGMISSSEPIWNVTYGYDDAGNLISIQDPHTSTTITISDGIAQSVQIDSDIDSIPSEVIDLVRSSSGEILGTDSPSHPLDNINATTNLLETWNGEEAIYNDLGQLTQVGTDKYYHYNSNGQLIAFNDTTKNIYHRWKYIGYQLVAENINGTWLLHQRDHISPSDNRLVNDGSNWQLYKTNTLTVSSNGILAPLFTTQLTTASIIQIDGSTSSFAYNSSFNSLGQQDTAATAQPTAGILHHGTTWDDTLNMWHKQQGYFFEAKNQRQLNKHPLNMKVPQPKIWYGKGYGIQVSRACSGNQLPVPDSPVFAEAEDAVSIAVVPFGFGNDVYARWSVPISGSDEYIRWGVPVNGPTLAEAEDAVSIAVVPFGFGNDVYARWSVPISGSDEYIRWGVPVPSGDEYIRWGVPVNSKSSSSTPIQSYINQMIQMMSSDEYIRWGVPVNGPTLAEAEDAVSIAVLPFGFENDEYIRWGVPVPSGDEYIRWGVPVPSGDEYIRWGVPVPSGDEYIRWGVPVNSKSSSSTPIQGYINQMIQMMSAFGKSGYYWAVTLDDLDQASSYIMQSIVKRIDQSSPLLANFIGSYWINIFLEDEYIRWGVPVNGN